MKRRILLSVLICFTAFALCVTVEHRVIGSWYAKRYITNHYSWLHPGSVEFGFPFKTVVLKETTFDKEWVSGQLDTVTVVVATKEVRIEGGSIFVDADKRSKTGSGATGSSMPRTTFGGILLSVKKGDYRLSLWDVAGDVQAEELFFKRGIFTGTAPWMTVVLDGMGKVTKSSVTVGVAVGDVPAPKIPGLTSTTFKVVAEGIQVDLGKKSAEAKTVVLSDQKDEIIRAKEVSVAHRQSDQGEHQASFKAGSVLLQHPWISAKPEAFTDVSGLASAEDIALWSPLVVHMYLNDPMVMVSGSCQEWSDVVARGTILVNVPLDGRLHVGVKMKPNPHVLMDAPGIPVTCQPTSCSVFHALRRPFKYMAYSATGQLVERLSGPGTPGWVPIAGSGRMPLAVESLEDPGFQYHRGFIKQAYENSFLENIRTGKFTRGGSTLTMQLAKNVYLRREKTLLRKAQELILAMSMERCLTKTEIMELYLNVVEFGPDVYGIGQGAKHWFNKSPSELSPVEAFWMASILPKPRLAKAPGPDSLKGIEKLMSALAKQGKIPELVGGLDDVDTTGWEANP